jgi:hypothetical protein
MGFGFAIWKYDSVTLPLQQWQQKVNSGICQWNARNFRPLVLFS